jgi:hypothetical protein
MVGGVGICVSVASVEGTLRRALQFHTALVRRGENMFSLWSNYFLLILKPFALVDTWSSLSQKELFLTAVPSSHPAA